MPLDDTTISGMMALLEPSQQGGIVTGSHQSESGKLDS